jgi:hypothetical protein
MDGAFFGLDKRMVDSVAWRYLIHPEIMRLHFASKYRLSRATFELETVGLSPFVRRQYMELNYGDGFLSAFMHGRCTCTNANTRMSALCSSAKIYID